MQSSVFWDHFLVAQFYVVSEMYVDFCVENAREQLHPHIPYIVAHVLNH